MGFFNGLTLTLLTIAPLTMYFTQSQLRQMSAPSQLLRLLPILAIAVGIEILKGSIASGLIGAVFGEDDTPSTTVQRFEEILTVVVGAVIDIIVISDFIMAKAPRKALRLESDSGPATDVTGGLCPDSLTCSIQCAFGAAFWLVRFASPMVSNIRGAPGSDPNFLVAAVICNLQFIFIALLVAIANVKSFNNVPVVQVAGPLSGLVAVSIAAAGLVLSPFFKGAILGPALTLFGAQVVATAVYYVLFARGRAVGASTTKAKVQ